MQYTRTWDRCGGGEGFLSPDNPESIINKGMSDQWEITLEESHASLDLVYVQFIGSFTEIEKPLVPAFSHSNIISAGIIGEITTFFVLLTIYYCPCNPSEKVVTERGWEGFGAFGEGMGERSIMDCGLDVWKLLLSLASPSPMPSEQMFTAVTWSLSSHYGSFLNNSMLNMGCMICKLCLCNICNMHHLVDQYLRRLGLHIHAYT